MTAAAAHARSPAARGPSPPRPKQTKHPPVVTPAEVVHGCGRSSASSCCKASSPSGSVGQRMVPSSRPGAQGGVGSARCAHTRRSGDGLWDPQQGPTATSTGSRRLQAGRGLAVEGGYGEESGHNLVPAGRLPFHPFTTPRGRSRATFAARLARSHTSATSSTSL